MATHSVTFTPFGLRPIRHPENSTAEPENLSPQSAYRPSPQPVPAHDRFGRWTIVSNALLAAMLILALGAGGWLAADRYNFGGFGSGSGETPPGIPFGAAVQDEATPDDASIAHAEDCTVTPLTIDQIVAYVYDPYPKSTPGIESSPEFISPADAEASAEVVQEPAYASTEALAGATATFHMFEACIEADSYFQVWAMIQPTLVQSSILSVLPPLTGEEEFRELLADLEANGPGDPTDEDTIFWPLTTNWFSGSSVIEGRISRVVDQSIENTWMPTDTFLVTGYDSFFPDGSQANPATSIYDSDFDGTPEPVVGFDPRLKVPDCFSIIFSWSETQNMWLIQNPPVCG